MHLINNQPFFDLTEHIDFAGLEAIKKDLIYGIVKNRASWGQGAASTHNLYNKGEKSLIDPTWPKVMQDPSNPDHEYFKKLNYDRADCMMFARYTGDYTQMGQIVWLRKPYDTGPGGILNKCYAAGCYDTPLYEDFPTLRAWLEKQNIFSEIGRINFFLSAPGEPGQLHKDAWIGFPDNFILINLDPSRKEIYILDDNHNKVIVDSPAFTFDTRNWHGTVGGKYYSWTLRLEGMFSKEWAESVGIWETFKKPDLDSDQK
jgi:hypothetical protein